MAMKESEHPYSSIDVMLFQDELDHDCEDDEHLEVIQSVIIVSGDQQILLKTKAHNATSEIQKTSKSIQW